VAKNWPHKTELPEKNSKDFEYFARQIRRVLQSINERKPNMKMLTSMKYGTSRLAVFFCLSLAMASIIGSAHAAESPSKDPSPGLMDRMHQWQNKMSGIFHDTWQELWSSDDHSSGTVANAAIDVREQHDSYTVRLHLPGHNLEKVDVQLKDNTLHVVTPAGKNQGRYEQSVTLNEADPNGSLTVERKVPDDLLVITVPKASENSDASSHGQSPFPARTEWERDIIDHMQQMQREMDRAFEDAFGQFNSMPGKSGWFDIPQFGSSIDLQDKDDAYVVKVFVPDREAKNININVDGQTLKVEAKEEETRKVDEDDRVLRSMTHSAYSQVLTLPGPVQADKMDVQQKEGVLTITLPKAKA
jgi:HSP20 family protein